MKARTDKRDFSQGSIASNVMRIALPMLVAELVHMLYNLVDRMYIGHMEGTGTVSLTGMGLCVPLITTVGAFANMIAVGGAPLCSIARGENDNKKAQAIQETAFTLLLIFGVLLTVALEAAKRPLLTWLGGDAETLPYALDYFSVYVWGTVFSLIALGMNPYINMQGYPKISMLSVLLGAVVNIALDPIFIFALGMGIKGAALATVLSQAVSAAWVLAFFRGKKCMLRVETLRLEKERVRDIFRLGFSGFLFRFTNSVTQAVCNITLKNFGGALSTLYIGAMSVTNSMKDIVNLSNSSVAGGAVPVMSFNYGAKRYDRTRATIRFLLYSVLALNVLMTLAMELAPGFFAGLISSDPELINISVPCIRVFFILYPFMALQACGQNTFVALNRAKESIFFSIFRKLVLIVTFTLTLPHTRLGVMGVFAAEPLSEIIGGTCCFVTMRLTAYRQLQQAESAGRETFNKAESAG